MLKSKIKVIQLEIYLSQPRPSLSLSNRYDLLLNPPPTNPQWSYESSRARERKATDFTNKGQVIGRVYYLRGKPPNLTQEFQRWLRNPFSTSDPIDTYTLAMITSWISGVAFWSVLEFLLYRKSVKEAQHKENQRRLSQQNATLQLQLKERINDINRLKTSYENEIKRRDIQIQSLTSKNQQLETEISKTSKALEAQKRQEKNLQSKLEFYTNQEQSQQQQINELNGLITNYENQLKNPASKQKQNQQLQLELTKIKNERSQAESALADYKSQIKQLNQELSINHNSREQLQQQIKSLSQSLEESTQRQQELKLENEKKSAEINSIREEKEQIEEEIGNRELNKFELRIQKILHNSLNTQSNLIQTHFDVGSGDAGSKFVDFLVITKKSIVVIEAKNYQGEIRARDNVRNSNWISRDNRLNIDRNINSCWGTNPYQQVKNYIDAVMKKVNRMRPRVKIYGLVVFPNNAQISEEITQNIPANYYRVIKSNQILETIRELDNIPSSNSRFQNPQQIFNTYFNK